MRTDCGVGLHPLLRLPRLRRLGASAHFCIPENIYSVEEYYMVLTTVVNLCVRRSYTAVHVCCVLVHAFRPVCYISYRTPMPEFLCDRADDIYVVSCHTCTRKKNSRTCWYLPSFLSPPVWPTFLVLCDQPSPLLCDQPTPSGARRCAESSRLASRIWKAYVYIYTYMHILGIYRK